MCSVKDEKMRIILKLISIAHVERGAKRILDSKPIIKESRSVGHFDLDSLCDN